MSIEKEKMKKLIKGAIADLEVTIKEIEESMVHESKSSLFSKLNMRDRLLEIKKSLEESLNKLYQ